MSDTASGAALTESSRGGLGPASRMARRMLLRTPGRSILVMLLIAIPILGLTAIDTVEASREATPAETVRLKLGQAGTSMSIVSAPDPQLTQDPVDNQVTGSTDDTSDGSAGSAESSDSDLLTPSQILPAGTRTVSTRYADAIVETKTGLASLPAIQGEAWDPSLAGRYDLVDGRRPTAKNEIMVSPATLDRLGISPGGTATVTRPVKGAYTVVGTLRDAQLGTDGVQLYGTPGLFDGISGQKALTQTTFYLPDVDLSWSQIRKLNAQGATALSRSIILDPPPASVAPRLLDSGSGGNFITIVFIALLGAFGLFEVCLLAGAAFAVGARARQREFAILSSVGAERRTVFAVMSIEGILLGFLGGVVGVALGIAAAAIGIPLISHGVQASYPGFHVDPLVLVLIVLASTVSGWLAAAVPARAASKVDVVAALRGARRPPKVTLRRPLIGLFVLAGGSVVALMGGLVVIGTNQAAQQNDHMMTAGIVLLVIGPVVMQIGALMITPLILRWVTTFLARVGTAARIGSRDASRNPSRTVPALAAIMSTVFVAVFAMCLLSGGQALSIRGHYWQGPENSLSVGLMKTSEDGTSTFSSPDGVADAIDRSFPGARARVISSTPSFGSLGETAVSSYAVPRHAIPTGRPYFLSADSTENSIVVGSSADLALILGEKVSARSKATLASGGVVSLYPQYVSDGKVIIDTVPAASGADGQPQKPIRSVSVAATVQQPDHDFAFGTFMSPSTAKKLGVPFEPTSVMAQLATPPTAAQTDAFSASLLLVDSDFGWSIESGPDLYAATWSWALVGLTTIIALVSSGVALSLARADSRRDDEILASIGAGPALRRGFGFWQAIIIAGLGALIGAGLGLVPAFALSLRAEGVTSGYIPFSPPWLQLALTAIAMPLLIAAGSWALTRRTRQLGPSRRLPAA
ncbi:MULTISPECIES: ABC transporter permease [unclassified Frondihabitans]|uniref:ABC transporter permease n=1 Tax=unclassified Frondihabitans TaxID=2626248 RepID=UPI000F4E8F4D|nr:MULTISPECIES: ABC transporter permease [unclassified Frondihabitans]RPE76569.1 FtsX-like permease family protein [Frondihabitans sp. PhB153]RPF05156.1 FtsX-like permease family protein [Frondihabitans sp. PhB161]